MCGLFASIGYQPDSARLDIVTHRGPDGRGFEVYDSTAGPVALGHRRLAIIELSDAGLQPMADPSGRYHLVFNGEIYNYIELRETLLASGQTFAGHSDSEVLLRAYAVWGPDCLPKLRGMFAFLIWDDRDKVLFGARDRFGIKPLYLAGDALAGGGRIAFASEIKQLHGLPGTSCRMNIPRVHDYLASGILDHTAETMFQGVIQLRGGECIHVETAGGRAQARIERWYPVTAGHLALSDAEAAERFRHLMDESVRLHLRSDVAVGSCLSGGLDSSSLVCLMAGASVDPSLINTFSACFAEKTVDEKPYMEAVATHTGITPHYVFPRPEDVFENASTITWHQDEPFGSTSIMAQWSVFAAAHQAGIKVMLDGQGADEQLAGYHSGFPYYLSQLIRDGHLMTALETVQARKAVHGHPASEQIKRALVPFLPGWLSAPLRRKHQALTQENWLGSDMISLHGNPLGPMVVATAALGLATPVDLKTLCLSMTYASNLQMLLHWEDRNSMAHSIEARVPFLDHPVVEFSLALGNAHKIVRAETKHVLRRAMAKVLPAKVLNRQDKLGFQTPEHEWFRAMRQEVHDGVETTLSLYPDLLNAAGTRKLRDAMLDGSRPVDATLWRIISLGLWGKRFGVAAV